MQQQEAVVLLVEDQEDLRQLASKILETEGFKVVQASNGHDALDRFKEQSGKVNLIITDVMMPQMTGPDLVEKIHSFGIEEKIPVLYCSGYSSDDLKNHNCMDQGFFLEKPYTKKGLLAKVGQILSEPKNEMPGNSLI